tara:strand:+ start:763 stop:1497 length:735 start_codon:yes stop_codon:yes gene_type:complete
MGIFKNITKVIKKAAPIIGGSIGFMIGGAAGAAFGSGIGSLAAGRSAEESLMAGLLGYGVGSLGASAGYGPTAAKALPTQFGSGAMATGEAVIPTAVKSAETSGILSKLIPESTLGKVALAGGIGTLALGGLDKEEEENTMRPYPTGRSRLGMGLIGDKQYNLDDPDEKRQYFDDVRKRQGINTLALGGEVNGPGTGTSDSVPARLSDGEFVLTAKAMRGAGGGDRDLGAARMYDMMSELERVA